MLHCGLGCQGHNLGLLCNGWSAGSWAGQLGSQGRLQAALHCQPSELLLQLSAVCKWLGLDAQWRG